MKRNDPRCGSTCTRVAGSDWANWCRMLIICAAIEIARRGHSSTALSMGTYILARWWRYLFCGVCRSSLNFRALRPSTFIWCCPLGLCRFHVVARMWPLQNFCVEIRTFAWNDLVIYFIAQKLHIICKFVKLDHAEAWKISTISRPFSRAENDTTHEVYEST